MYGPPPGWNYKTASVGYNGELLPPDAIGWTEQGDPYYGYGRIPVVGNFLEWFKGAWDRINRPSQGYVESKAPEGTASFDANKLIAPLQGEAGQEATLLQKAGRGAGEAVRGLGEGLNVLANAAEMGLGGLEGLQRAGAGSGLPDIESKVRSSIPEIAGRGFWSDLGRGFTNFVLDLNPLLIGYNSVRALASPLSLEERRDISEGNLQASRIAYSAWVDPALREDFIRRYNAGEDPYLLQQELQIPGAELIGQLVLDPLNLVGGFLGKAGKAGDLAQAADRLDAAGDVAKAVGEGEKLSAISRLTQVVMVDATDRAKNISDLSRKVGLFTGTSGAKRFVVGERINGILQTVFAANKNDPEGGIELLDALVKMASRDEGEVLDGLSRVVRDDALARVWLSDDGLDTAVVLRNMLSDESGVVDATKFLDDLKGKPLDEIVRAVTRKTDDAIERAFPSMAERIGAAGKIADLEKGGKSVPANLRKLASEAESISPQMRALEAFDRVAQSKLYQPVNRFFAAIYMGLSPGYAFRNFLTNSLHMLVDYGPGVFAKSPATRTAETLRWLGGVEPRLLTQGLTQTKGAVRGAATRLLFAQASDKLEQVGAEMVYGRAVEQAMRRMLQPGRALPKLNGLIEAGMDPRSAAYVAQLVSDNYGDVAKAMQAFRGAFANGSVEAWRTMGWAEPRFLRALESVPSGGQSLSSRLMQELQGVTERGQIDEIASRVLKEFEEEAAHVAKEGVPIAKGLDGTLRGTQGAIVRAVSDMKGVAPKEAEQFLIAIEQADHNVIKGYMEALGSVPSGGPRVTRLQEAWNATSKASDELTRSAVDEWKQLVATAKARGETAAGSPEARRLWDAYTQELLSMWQKTRDDIVTRAEADFQELAAQGLIANPDDALEFARKAYGEAQDWHSATREGADWVVRRTRPSPDAGVPLAGRWFSESEESARAYSTAKGSVGGKPVVSYVDVPQTELEGWTVKALRDNPNLSQAELRNLESFRDPTDRIAPTADWSARRQQLTEESAPVGEGLQRLFRGETQAEWDLFGPDVRKLIPPYNPDTMPTASRSIHEMLPTIKTTLETWAKETGARWGEKIPVFADEGIEAALNKWAKTAEQQVGEARYLAKKNGDAARRFTLLSYPEKAGFDMVAGYVFPYQFWYSRTYVNWMKRVTRNPALLAHYAKYRGTMEELHAGAPDWWKYNINSNELLGLDSENPLFFNLEATLNPLNGLTGVDFNDSQKREGWFAATLDDLGKFGPSTWTPFSIATALAMYSKGDQEAASRWAGRLFPQTASIKGLLGMLRHKVSDLPLQGEYDPFVQLFSGGLDPYERRRVGRALGWMVDNGQIDQASALDAAHSQSGPIWDAALDRAVTARAPGQLASFLFGVGFKARSASDAQIDQFYSDWGRLWAMEPNLSPDEFKRSMDELRNAYPFMDTVLVSKKGGTDRDRAFAYTVLGRIPPGQSSDFATWANIDPSLLDKFYSSKGHIETWGEADRTRFMAGVLDLSAVLNVPDNATRTEWTDAKNRYNRVVSDAEAQFGSDIWDVVDLYYAAKDGTDAGNKRAEAILNGDPRISQALDFKQQRVMSDPLLFDYYASMGAVEGYAKGQMYREMETALGKDIWQKWDEYYSLLPSERRAYRAEHPELTEYTAIKRKWQPIIDAMIVEFGSKLRDVPVDIREGAGGTLGQEQLLEGIEGRRAGFPQLSWQEWQQQLGPSLSRLIEDYVYSGEELPDSAMGMLGDVGSAFGIESAGVMLQIVAQSAGGQ